MLEEFPNFWLLPDVRKSVSSELASSSAVESDSNKVEWFVDRLKSLSAARFPQISDVPGFQAELLKC